MPAINFGNVKELSSIPRGTYNARLDDYENDIAGTDGSDMVKATFEITEDGEFNGRKMVRNFSLKESALWAVKRACIAMGTNPEVFEADVVDTDELFDELRGAECRLVVKEKMYDGEKRSEIKSILAPAYEFGA
jgi:hypothetical protein